MCERKLEVVGYAAAQFGRLQSCHSPCAMPSGARLVTMIENEEGQSASGQQPAGSRCALPIAAPGPADRRLQDASHQPICEFAVTLPAMIFEPAGMGEPHRHRAWWLRRDDAGARIIAPQLSAK